MPKAIGSLQVEFIDSKGFQVVVFAIEELMTKLPLAKGAGGI